MHVRKLVLGMILSGATAFSAPVLAQTYIVDTAAIVSGCSTSAGACTIVVQAAITALQAAGLSAAALNAELGVIASTALLAAASLPPAQLALLSAVMMDIAAASTDPLQKQALTELASALESGTSVDLVAVASALSAS